jgi:hypothetical protein
LTLTAAAIAESIQQPFRSDTLRMHVQTLFYIREAKSTEGPAKAPTWENLPIGNGYRWGLDSDLEVWSGVPGCTTNHSWQKLAGVTQQLVFDEGVTACSACDVIISQLDVTIVRAVHNSATD